LANRVVDSSKESRQVCGKGNTSRFDWTHAVKSPGVVCDGYRVIFVSG